MNTKADKIKFDLTRVNIKNVANFLSCALALFPSLFSDLISGWSTYLILLIYLFSLLFAAYSISSRNLMEIKILQLRPSLLWLVVFLICVLNRNGDISHSNYRPILHFIFIIFYATFFVAQNKIFVKNFLRVLTVYLLIHLVLGFYFLANPNVLLNWGSHLFKLSSVFSSKFYRFVKNGAFMGLTSHYSTSGMYMALAVILVAAFLFAYRMFHSKWNAGYIVLFVAFFTALALTQKRAHFLFSIAALIAMYLVGYVKGDLNRRVTQVALLIIFGVIALIAFLQIPAFQRIISRFSASDSLDEASTGRISKLWIPALNEFKKNPLIGMGWRQFKYVHPQSNGVRNDVHNIYIQFFAENGIVGGLYIVILMIYNYITSWKLLVKSKYGDNRDDYLYLLFSFGYQTFFIFYGLTGNPFYDTQCFFPYMICCGITYLYQYEYKKEASKNKMLKVQPKLAK